MALMALDHASYFIAKVHPAEFWGVALPRYPDALAFFTRGISHLCAPGFFLLMGAAVALFAESRRRRGWSEARLFRHFLTRGALLIVLEQGLENPAWLLGALGAAGAVETYGVEGAPGMGGDVWIALLVLYALGATMIACAALNGAPTWLVLTASVAAMLATQTLLPAAKQAGVAYAPLARLLLIPGQTGPLFVAYPIVPWLAPAALGLALGRRLARAPGDTATVAFAAGGTALFIFAVLRVGLGVGDFHPPSGSGWIAILNLTKYPPSVDFLLASLGVNLVLLGVLARTSAQFAWQNHPLAVFGRVPLFFYFLHLYLYAVIGFAFPAGVSLPRLYPLWAAGLVILYPACRRYARFKQARGSESLWALF